MDELPTESRSMRTPGRIAGARRSLAEMPRALMQANPAEQARWILQAGFVAAPFIAGADKFFNRLCRWEKYLAPAIKRRLPVSASTFMRGFGVVEMSAAALVLGKPELGAYVVAGWLGGIVGNLLLARDYGDIALRDIGLMLGAIALGRLAGR